MTSDANDDPEKSQKEQRPAVLRKSRRRDRSTDTTSSSGTSNDRRRHRRRERRRRHTRTPSEPRERSRKSRRTKSPSESHQRPHEARRSSSSLKAEDVLQLLAALQGGSSKNLASFSQHLNVIPEFDPNNKSQSTDRWIKKVNECSVIYGWDERQTMHFALQKLCGLAKKWYESLSTVNYTWAEWQEKISKAFPNDENYGKLLEEMLSRVSRPDENLREYFYEKLSLLGRCDIKGKKAVDCIIYGITDISVRNGAQALRCNEPEELLNYLVSQHPQPRTFSGSYRKRDYRSNNTNSHTPPESHTTSNNKSSTAAAVNDFCFNCKEKGHFFTACTKPLVKCRKCTRVGHDSESCNRKPLSATLVKNRVEGEKKTLNIS